MSKLKQYNSEKLISEGSKSEKGQFRKRKHLNKGHSENEESKTAHF